MIFFILYDLRKRSKKKCLPENKKRIEAANSRKRKRTKDRWSCCSDPRSTSSSSPSQIHRLCNRLFSACTRLPSLIRARIPYLWMSTLVSIWTREWQLLARTVLASLPFWNCWLVIWSHRGVTCGKTIDWWVGLMFKYNVLKLLALLLTELKGTGEFSAIGVMENHYYCYNAS